MSTWREVSMRELHEVWDDLRERGICYNGCTWDALIEKYGPEHVKHVAGKGWYRDVPRQH